MKILYILKVVFLTDCFQLVKMVGVHYAHQCKEFFPTFAIQHIPKTQNKMMDKLTRGAKNMSSTIVYVDSVFQRWFSNQKSV